MICTEQKTASLGVNAKEVASKRYSRKTDSGEPTEDWDAIVERVVSHVAAAETDSQEREDFYLDLFQLALY